MWQWFVFLLMSVWNVTVRGATSPTKVTISINSITVNTNTEAVFNGAQFQDYFKFEASGVDCSTVTPNNFINLANPTRTLIISPVGTYQMCYRSVGESDSVAQTNGAVTVIAATSATKVTVSPTSWTINIPTSITYTGSETGDKYQYTAPGGTSCAGVRPHLTGTAITGNNQPSTVTLSQLGVYRLCYTNVGGTDSIIQTNTITIVAATSATKISIYPTRISVNAASQITFTGSVAGDKYAFSAVGAADCTGVIPNINIAGTNQIETITMSSQGVYKLCYRNLGGSDSVRQTNSDLTVGATSATAVTLSPTSWTVNLQASVTFTNSQFGDRFTFAAQGVSSCTGVTPSTYINSADEVHILSFSAVGTYQLCYQQQGETDSVAQTNGVITNVAVTPGTKITISPSSIFATQATSITFTGSVAGDRFQFSGAGVTDCSGIQPHLTGTLIGSNDATVSITMTSSGFHKMCYTNVGGSDVALQQMADLYVQFFGGGGSDPVAVYGGVRRGFVLPPSELVELLRTPDMTLHGETFSGRGDWEQWFRRMVLVSRDGSQWLQVAIKPNIIDFNRTKSKAWPNAFQSLEVAVGKGGNLHSPEWSQLVPTIDNPIPFGFLGADLKFHVWRPSFISQAIGKARRECLEAAFVDIQFMICSTPATEFSGKQAHLAIKYAHIDLILLDADEANNFHGLFPELWGFKPLSPENAKYVLEPDDTATV